MNRYVVFFLCLSLAAAAQKKSTVAPITKKPLTHDVYDGWKEITYKALTPDGTQAAFTINPQDGDGKVVFYNLKTNTQDSVKRADNISLSFDSKFAVFKIKPQQKVVKELRRQKKKKEDLPKDSLGIYSFANRKTEKIADVRSFRLPEKAGEWLAYQREAAKEIKPKTDAKDAPKPKKVKKNTDDNGYTLVLRNLSTNEETLFGFVKDFSFAKYGQGLLFSSTGNDSTMKAGVYWYDLQAGQLTTLHEGKAKFKYKGLAISDDGTQSAFLVDTDTTKALVRHFQLYHWKKGDANATWLDAEGSKSLPGNWLMSEYFTPQFSKNGGKLFFGSGPTPLVQDTTLLTEEIVQVEVWGGNDPLIYPQQNKQLDAEKKRSYLAYADLSAKRFVQLATPDMPDMQFGDEGNAAVFLGESNVPYRKIITWDASAYNDAYLVSANGERKNIAKRMKAQYSFSSKANYVTWYSATDTAWFTYSITTGATHRLQNPKVSWADEENDVPDYPGAYGTAGWTKDDQAFLVYDRYDIWSLDPENKRAPINVTKTGRTEKTTFRYLRLDDEERFIDPEKELLLSAFNEVTRASGFYKLSLKTGQVTKLVMDNFRFAGAIKAKSANQLLYTRQSFQEFPDVWTADLNLANAKKISNANPQSKNYLWGTVELVSWTSLDNIPLQGLLYKPENFDPKKKYPMIVNFYERNSENLHAHNAPFPHRSTINQTMYTSNGYLVFVPDVVYKTGFPGESAHNCILPGVTALISKGFVDEKNIGIQGHSWGGYQISYLVTRTNMFKAAEAGAVVANMISAYGGIRWESGLSRMFQYEHAQSRIGGSLWEKPMHFIENSPIFFADKIQTPLLLLHNDADGAVPWYQGIEMYMALRRLDKPVWMLNYNGEPHWPLKRENRIDFQTRMMQFFDHYLKGAAMPDWMKGLPAVEKGIRKGY